MAEQRFTKEHLEAIEKAIANKKANPGMEFLTDAINAAAAGAGAAAVGALVGADAQPVDPHTIVGKVPKGGFSLDDLMKAREHILKNIH